MRKLAVLFWCCFAVGCADSQELPAEQEQTMYFPAVNSASWEQIAPTTVGVSEQELAELRTFLASTNTYAFIALVNGRIVVEEYFAGRNAQSELAWNSAGKTLSSALVGIAESQGYLQRTDVVSQHLGQGWTNCSLENESLIRLSHLLSMTSGLDDEPQWVQPANLNCLADAGTRWAYGNVYKKLQQAVATATSQEFDDYFATQLQSPIGMSGHWNHGLLFSIYHSNARSMARFGLLALNKGRWQQQQIIPSAYFQESISSSQSLNPSYGYLWWLNGQSGYRLPNSQQHFAGPLLPHAPQDMYMAMGANEQRIYVVPSKKLVIVRMGTTAFPNDSDALFSNFDAELWQRWNAITN